MEKKESEAFGFGRKAATFSLEAVGSATFLGSPGGRGGVKGRAAAHHDFALFRRLTLKPPWTGSERVCAA